MLKGFNAVARLLTSFTLFFLVQDRAHAQVAATDSILAQPTLSNVIQYALNRQPAIQQSLIDEKTTELQIKSKLADWYPQLNFNYLYQHNFQVQTNIIGGNPVRLGVDNTSALQFSASQVIFNRDVLLAKRTGTDVRQLSRQLTNDVRIDVAVNVSKAFYDLLSTEQQIKVLSENITRLERSLRDARAQFDAGIADKTDYKRATIALNNARAARKANEETLRAKITNLKSLINYPAAADLAIQYDSAALERELTLDTLSIPDYKNRIEYRILETQRRLQESNIRYQKWSYLPTVSANAAYNMNFLNNNFGKLYNQSFPNSFAGLTLSVPIFQGGKRKYNIEQAEWALKNTDLDILSFKNAANAEYAAAIASYKANLYNFLALKENVLLAQEVYDVINLQYRAGIKTYLEVISAETDLRTSKLNYFEALYRVLSSKIDVQRSTGNINY
jgi:outer membrane protein